MNILHLALVSESNDGAIDRGMVKRGHNVTRIDWRRDGVKANNAALLSVGKADVVFYQGQGGKTIRPEVLQRLKEGGAYVVNWTGDVRDDVDWYANMAPYVNLTLFTNLTDVDKMAEMGHRADYLQTGYDDRIYNLGEPKPREGVVFMGNNYGHRFPQGVDRIAMVDTMQREFGADFKLFGKGWPGRVHLHSLSEVIEYRRSVVAINFDHYLRPMFASDRILRAQACGCAVVSQGYPGIGDEHSLVGSCATVDDMVKMVRYALNNPDKAKALGEQSAKHVAQSCTWERRIEQLEQLILKHE